MLAGWTEVASQHFWQKREKQDSQIMDTEEHLDQYTGQTIEDTWKPWATCN